MKRFLCLLSLCLIAQWLPAQRSTQEKIDSLMALLPAAKEDTNKVNIFNHLSYNYPYIDPAKGLEFGNQAFYLATKLKWTKGIANAHAAIGGNYANKAEYAKALEHEFEALKIYEQLKDPARQAVMLRNLAIVFRTSKNFEKALEYNNKSLALYRSINDKEGVAAVYSNMANVYYSMKEKDKVIEYNMKALQIYEETRNMAGVARITGNIANFYAEYGDYGKAMPYYFDALRKETALGNKNGVTRNLGNIGETYLDIARSDEPVKPDSLIPAGKQANLNKALDYLKRTISGAKELQQTEYVMAFQETLSDALMLSGNTSEAFHNYKEYISIRDSVYDEDKHREATRRELDYEYGKREDSLNHEKALTNLSLAKEKKIRSQEKIFFMGGLILVLIFSAFMYNRWRITQNQKKVIEKEKQRSEELLLNILPAETAEELKLKGSADAKHHDDVTIMFTDFQNFSTISENLTPAELVAEIHGCFMAFDNIIGKYGIEKIKTIGDSYMCAGGLPVPTATHAADVVKAALEMQQYMNEHLKNSPLNKFGGARIGVHTGPVVAGIVGIKKFAYDIWGDTVNIASRMESSGEAGKVNISGTTYELIKDKFNCKYRGKVSAKNKGEIDMYFVEK